MSTGCSYASRLLKRPKNIKTKSPRNSCADFFKRLPLLIVERPKRAEHDDVSCEIVEPRQERIEVALQDVAHDNRDCPNNHDYPAENVVERAESVADKAFEKKQHARHQFKHAENQSRPTSEHAFQRGRAEIARALQSPNSAHDQKTSKRELKNQSSD